MNAGEESGVSHIEMEMLSEYPSWTLKTTATE